MSVKYVVTAKGNPSNPEAPKKFYAQCKSVGEITLKALGKEISQRSTVNTADTLAVLESLTQVMSERLAEGQIVRFGDFGSFQISVSSEGAEITDKFHSGMIKSKKITFRPGIDLREMLNNLRFERM